MSYDAKCYELAEHFLPSIASDRIKNDLAQAIQDAIEGWIETEVARIDAVLAADRPPMP